MIRLGTMLAAALVMSAVGAMANAKMATQTFTVLAGAGAHDGGIRSAGRYRSLRHRHDAGWASIFRFTRWKLSRSDRSRDRHRHRLRRLRIFGQRDKLKADRSKGA